MKNQDLRKLIIETSYKAKACHIGSALSCIDIIDSIYKIKKQEDLFIFSKASGICALYVVLAKHGIIKEKKISYYLKHYPLPHSKVPGVIWSGGSLGHGLPVAVGLALADRTRKVYVLMGDAEIACGTTFESIVFAKHHKLTNLKIYIDKNKLQACGTTKEILDIDEALQFLKQLFPIKVIRTIKGKGIDFMENNYEWHYLNLTPELYEKALLQVSNRISNKR